MSCQVVFPQTSTNSLHACLQLQFTFNLVEDAKELFLIDLAVSARCRPRVSDWDLHFNALEIIAGEQPTITSTSAQVFSFEISFLIR